jgi:hypothetical protein
MSGIKINDLSLNELECLRHEVFLREEELKSNCENAYIIRLVSKYGYCVEQKNINNLPSLIMKIELKYYTNKPNRWANLLRYLLVDTSINIVERPKDANSFKTLWVDTSGQVTEGVDSFVTLYLYYTSYNTSVPEKDFAAINDFGHVMEFKYDDEETYVCNGEQFTKDALQELISGEPGYYSENNNERISKLFVIPRYK